MSACSPALRERPAPAVPEQKKAAGTCLWTRLRDVCVVYRQENEQGITLKITLMRHIFIWKAGRSSRQGDKRNRSRRALARGPLLYKGLGIGVFFAAPRVAGGEIRRKAHCKPAAPNKPRRAPIRAFALRGRRCHARRSPRGRDDVRGRDTNRAARAWCRAPNRTWAWELFGKVASHAPRPRSAARQCLTTKKKYTYRAT